METGYVPVILLETEAVRRTDAASERRKFVIFVGCPPRAIFNGNDMK